MIHIKFSIALITILYLGSASANQFDVKKFCKENICRQNTGVKLAIDEEHYWEATFPASPYVVDDTINLIPGETLFIEASINEKKLYNFKIVKEIKNPDKTITIKFSQPNTAKKEPGMLMSIDNPFKNSYRYKLTIMPFGKNRLFNTSSCPVFAGKSVFESWPYPLTRVLLSEFILIDDSNDLVCKKW